MKSRYFLVILNNLIFQAKVRKILTDQLCIFVYLCFVKYYAVFVTHWWIHEYVCVCMYVFMYVCI